MTNWGSRGYPPANRKVFLMAASHVGLVMFLVGLSRNLVNLLRPKGNAIFFRSGTANSMSMYDTPF